MLKLAISLILFFAQNNLVLAKRSISESKIITTVTFDDYDPFHRITLPLSSFSNNSYVKIIFPKTGRIGTYIDFKNTITGLQDKVEESVEISYVNEEDSMYPQINRRSILSNTNSTVYNIIQNTSPNTYYLKFSSKDSSVFSSNVDINISFIYRGFTDEVNPADFDNASDLGTLTSSSPLTVTATDGYSSSADDVDIFHFHKFKLEENKIIEIVHDGGRFRNYNSFFIYDSNKKLIERKILTRGRFIKDMRLIALTAGDYYIEAVGNSGYRGNFTDTSFILRDSNLEYKTAQAKSLLETESQSLGLIETTAFSATTDSIETIFTSIPYIKDNGNQVLLPLELRLNNKDKRCKKKQTKQQLGYACSTGPLFKIFRGNEAISITPTITKFKKRKNKYIIEANFSNDASQTELQPDLQSGRFIIKSQKNK